MASASNRTRILIGAVIVVVTAAAVVAATVFNDPDDEPVVGQSSTTTATATSAPRSTTEPPSTTAPESTTVELTRWSGRYVWSEFVEGDPGSDQTLVHELTLGEVSDDGMSISGSLVQQGFQTFAEMDVLAVAGDGSILIEFVALRAGAAPYTEAEILFRLDGEPERPTTTIESLVTLLPDPEPETLFVREQDAVAAPLPATVWGVNADTFDLVQVELATGNVLRTVAGWGPDFAEQSEGGGQALQFVEVEAGSDVWVDDCCEPAFGTTFRIGPDTTSIENAPLKVFGLGAELSFDGRLVALGVGDIGIAVLDAETGAEVVSPGSLAPLIGTPDGIEADLTFPTPVTWLSETTLAVATDSADRTAITLLDVSDPLAPASVGEPITVDGLVFDADVRFDGRLVLLVDQPNTTPTKELVVIDLPTRSEVERIELADGTSGIDYDETRRHLLVVDGDGMLQVFGKVGLETQLGPFVDAGW